MDSTPSPLSLSLPADGEGERKSPSSEPGEEEGLPSAFGRPSLTRGPVNLEGKGGREKPKKGTSPRRSTKSSSSRHSPMARKAEISSPSQVVTSPPRDVSSPSPSWVPTSPTRTAEVSSPSWVPSSPESNGKQGVSTPAFFLGNPSRSSTSSLLFFAAEPEEEDNEFDKIQARLLYGDGKKKDNNPPNDDRPMSILEAITSSGSFPAHTDSPGSETRLSSTSLLNFPAEPEEDNELEKIQAQVLYGGSVKKKDSSNELHSISSPIFQKGGKTKDDKAFRFGNAATLSRMSKDRKPLFQKKKKEKGWSVGGEEKGKANSWKEGLDDLKGLKKVAVEFYQKIDAHFCSVSPGLSDNCKEFHNAFTTYILPNLLHNKKKMHSFTKYLHAITDLLGSERGGPLGVVEKIEKVEDIEQKWVVKAEAVWKSSQWVKVLFKTGQESKETLIKSEVDGWRDLTNEYLQFLKGTKEPVRRQILEKICFFLLEHLSTHSLDPYNLFVGLVPSDTAIERLFLPFHTSERRTRRADTLGRLFETGWQQSQKKVREERKAEEGGDSDRVKRKKPDQEVQEHGKQQEQGERENEQKQERRKEKESEQDQEGDRD